MLLYKCCFLNKEIVSDSYPQKTPLGKDEYKDIGFEVDSKMISTNEDYGIECNPDEDGVAEGGAAGGDDRAIDLVHHFQLQSCGGIDKKSLTAFVKKNLQKLGAKRGDKLTPEIKNALQPFLKEMIGQADDIEIYAPEGYDFVEADFTPVFSYYKEGFATPTFVYLNIYLDTEKC